MKAIAAALGSGVLFGVGLGISGMTQADKVINFLDITDSWDPSLALVMVGAIGVHLVLFRLILRRPSPVLGAHFGVPTRTDIDLRLVGGAAIFGIGWGIGGYCPGPGLVAVSSGAGQAVVFIAALIGGISLFHWAESLRGQWQGQTVAETSTGPVQVISETRAHTAA